MAISSSIIGATYAMQCMNDVGGIKIVAQPVVYIPVEWRLQRLKGPEGSHRPYTSYTILI